MGEANENRRRRNNAAMKNLFDNYPRDLLQRFMASSSNAQAQQSKYLKEEQREEEEEEEEVREEIELNLGLSLGGRFGVDKSAKNKLIRSSSIACTIPSIREADETTAPVSVLYPTLMRTASLPTETEEEWRKRKELQSLRRLEAKRRRSEKQKNPNPNPTPNANKEGVGGGGGLEEERKEIEGSIGFNSKQSQYTVAAAAGSGCNRFGATVASPFGFRSWAAAARQPVVGGGIDVSTKGKSGFVGGMQGFGQPNSQGSVESQGGSSSGMSEFESKPVQGSGSGGEARSPASNQSSQERSNQETLSSSTAQATENTGGPSGAVENPSRRPELTESRGREIGRSALEGMPYVFTKGDGPNGRRIEGILYKYGKGEEVRIICVCHGSFLSPAEFVKHAGGGDVAHPLRHIVVNPSSNSFL